MSSAFGGDVLLFANAMKLPNSIEPSEETKRTFDKLRIADAHAHQANQANSDFKKLTYECHYPKASVKYAYGTS